VTCSVSLTSKFIFLPCVYNIPNSNLQPMIVTGPLSMNLHSSIAHELSNGEVNGIGMRIVDVGERGEFKHKWTLLDNEEEIFEHAIERCERQLMSEEKLVEALME
jgi:hypothetical protein